MLTLLKKIGAGRRGDWQAARVLVVAERRVEAEDIVSFRLEADDGTLLPAFTPGAHLDVYLENGLRRQYSICSDPADLSHYRIAVLREQRSRGGSAFIHDSWQAGTRVGTSAPRNTFELVENEARFHLFAGGIGITPLLPMVLALQRAGREFTLHYYARTPAHAAFLDRLAAVVAPERLFLHFSRGPGRRLEVGRLLACIPPCDYVYCCGPASMIEAVRAARPAERCRLERFTVDQAPTCGTARPFEVLLAQSGDIFTVPEDKSLLETLEERGYPVASSCREGICGACQLAYTEGEVVHRDNALDAATRQRMLASCVSRAHGHVVLDL